jgi:hypothetical protein
MWPFGYKYDAFISHAVEDKLPIANELCNRLEKEGLRIWYSGKELSVGDTLDKTIHKGLSQSRFGVVILSSTYVDKNWTMREFYALLGKEIRERKVILPVLFNITLEELLKHDITIAGKYCVSFDKGMDHVVERLVKVIKEPRPWVKVRQFLVAFLAVSLITFLSYYGYMAISRATPEEALISRSVEDRMEDFAKELDQDFKTTAASAELRPAQQQDIIDHFISFKNLQSHFRNEYEFTNGLTTIRFKKNVEPALNINFETLSPHNNYDLMSPHIFLIKTKGTDGNTVITYVYVNTQPPEYIITEQDKVDEDKYKVTVSFTNNIRYWIVNLEYPPAPGLPKKSLVQIKGFLPQEDFIFEKDGQQWTLADKN